MVKGKQINFKDMSNEDLKNRLSEFFLELISARQKARLGQFKKTSEFGRLRKEIARIKTELRKREIGQATA